MTPGSTSNDPQFFRCDRSRAAASLSDPDGKLWPVNAYSDADELNLLAKAAQSAGILAAEVSGAHLCIYPMSISEPEPLLAVDLGRGPTLLGPSLRLTEAVGEDPISFSLRFLADLATAASALAAAPRADSDCLDLVAASESVPESGVRSGRGSDPRGKDAGTPNSRAYSADRGRRTATCPAPSGACAGIRDGLLINRPGQWSGADVCEFVATELQVSVASCSTTPRTEG
jgi:hypothetical protein